MRRLQHLFGLLGALLLLGAVPARAAGPACDRTCLEGVLDKYLTALAARAPKHAPLARDARFVENNEALKFGDGTWKTIDGLGHYRHVFADPQADRVAAITVVKENGVLAIFDVVLTLRGRQVVEAEHQINRDPRGAAKYEEMGKPEAVWLTAVPTDQRISREQLIAVSDKYLQGMQRNDPNGDYSFFDKDCDRIEHAVQTTNLKTPEAYGHSNDTAFSSLGCEAQFKTGFLGFVTRLRDRRFLVVDEERQAVFALADLDHNGTVRILPSVNGKSSPIPDYFNVPRTLRAGEAYRMRGDKLYRIEMTLTELPYGMRPGGSPAPKAAAKPAPADRSCDRDCLSGKLTQLLQAMVNHNPAEAPLAPGVRYTENGQELQAGDGLWNTATAIAIPGDGLAALGPDSSAYKLLLADPATGQAAALSATNEQGTPGMLALRIQVVDGKISEIEAFVVRNEHPGSRGGAMTLFRPLMLAEFNPKGFADPDPALIGPPAAPSSRAALMAAPGRYFEALARGQGAGAGLSAACQRRTNGAPTTGNAQAVALDPALPAFRPFALGCAAQIDGGLFRYVTGIRDERVLVADADHGLVLAAAMLDHNGSVATLTTPAGAAAAPSNLRTPATEYVVGLFKVDGGQTTFIESLDRIVPYGMEAGW